jgi:saccharopine dehydrogenase-like NADP-dependent oxidoreductase
MMHKKKILVLGSGLISEPLIDYLMKRDENKITIASNNTEELKIMMNRKKNQKNFDNLRSHFLDVVNQKDQLLNLISKNDIVIGLVPAFLIIYVAKACIEAG